MQKNTPSLRLMVKADRSTCGTAFGYSRHLPFGLLILIDVDVELEIETQEPLTRGQKGMSLG